MELYVLCALLSGEVPFLHVFEKLMDWTNDGLGLQCYQPCNQRPNSWTKVLRVFFFAIHTHLYRFALRFLLLQTRATLLLYRNLKSAISKDYAQKTQRNSTFMNSASGVYVLSKRSGDGWRPVAKFIVPDLGG
jgi:hypothetical protein